MITRAAIRSAENRYPARSGLSAAECYVHEFWMHKRTNDAQLVPSGRPMPLGVALDADVYAYINRRRWVVMCPVGLDWQRRPIPGQEPCWGAQMASLDDPRFFCTHCGNEHVGGVWLPVVFPADADEIMALVGMREDDKNANWEIWETAEDIAAENKRYGVI
jgi:hypothetical protein